MASSTLLKIILIFLFLFGKLYKLIKSLIQWLQYFFK